MTATGGSKWSTPGSGERYATTRWRSSRRAGRDPRLVARLLDRAGEGAGLLLDAPCGAGRLGPVIRGRSARLVGLDLSASMLGAAREHGMRDLVQGDLSRLPFADRSFDVVIACRILHHLHGEDTLSPVVSELVRVSRGLVLASFWDDASLPGLARRSGLRRGEGPGGRVHHPRRLIRSVFEGAGSRILEFKSPLPLLSSQTFAVARASAPR